MIVGVFKYKVNRQFKAEFDSLYSQMAGHIAKIDGYTMDTKSTKAMTEKTSSS